MKSNEYRNDIIILAVTLILSVIIIFSSKFIFSGGFLSDKLNKNVEYYKAEITGIVKEKLQDDKYIEGIELGYQEVNLKVLDGKFKDKQYKIINNISRLYNTKVKEGSTVIVSAYLDENGEVTDMSISSFKRSHIMMIMVGIFFVLILAVGRFKGLKSIVSLVFTIICIVYLMLPLMLRGISPILSSILIAIISISITLLLVGGISRKSFSTILGTLSGVLLSGILAYVFGRWSNLSGINMSEADSIMYIAEVTGLKIQGIMFAGILISALGAVMDVAMSISSSIFEIHSINSEMSIFQLFKSGMNIGRDIIGTMSNTLILAFAGGSLNTLILIYTSKMDINRLLNLDVLGTELIQGLAGSIGIILTVPITAIIASYLCNKEKIERI